MRPDADLSPRGLARLVAAFLETLDLDDVLLVGSDTGGAVSQLVLDEAPDRVGRLVLTNCDAFDTFPPFPFDWLFRLARHEGPSRLLLQSMRPAVLRQQLARLRLAGPPRPDRGGEPALDEPYLTDAGVRRDVTSFALDWTGAELADAGRWLARFDRPVLLAWAPRDPFFGKELAARLLSTFPDATLVEFPDARTFVSLDEPSGSGRRDRRLGGPHRLASEHAEDSGSLTRALDLEPPRLVLRLAAKRSARKFRKEGGRG